MHCSVSSDKHTGRLTDLFCFPCYVYINPESEASKLCARGYECDREQCDATSRIYACFGCTGNTRGRGGGGPRGVLQNQIVHTWGLIKRSLQGVMYSVTIRLGLNPSAKDRRWSSRKKLIFSRKILRWIFGGMPVHLHICRPRSLVEGDTQHLHLHY